MKLLPDFLARVVLSRNTRVHRAVCHGDVAALEKALEEGGDVDHVPSEGTRNRSESAVHISVYRNDPDCLRVLLAHGARVNDIGNARNTPLYNWFEMRRPVLERHQNLAAIAPRTMEVGVLLIQHGANIGTSSRHHVFAGTTRRTMFDNLPILYQLEQWLESEVQARDLAHRAPPVQRIATGMRL